MTRKLILALVAGGAVAGVVDIGAASLINQAAPDVILRVIARGLLGRPAMDGGVPVAILGLVLQLAMSVLIALIYGLASLKLPMLTRRWVAWGLLYGLGVFVVMEFVVVPLSAIGAVPHFKTALYLGENIAAMLVFGLIVAWSAHRGAVTEARAA